MDMTLTHTHSFNIWGLRYRIYSDSPEVIKYFKRAYSLFGGDPSEKAAERDVVIKIRAKNKKMKDILSDVQGDIYYSWMKYFSGRAIFFHASSVEIGDCHVLFAGSPGSGKSTMAAMIRDMGFRVLNDDFSPVDHRNKRVVSFPTFSNIRRGGLSDLQKEYDLLMRKYFRKFGALRRDYLFDMPDKDFESYYSYNRRLYGFEGDFNVNLKSKKRFIAVFLNKARKSADPKLSKVDFPDSFNAYINSMHMPLDVFNRNLKVIIGLFGDFECYSLSRGPARRSAELILSRFK